MIERKHRFTIRFNDEELKLFEEKVASAFGENPKRGDRSKFLRALIKNARIASLEKREFRKNLLRQITMAGNNLNQIARWVNTSRGAVEGIQVCIALLEVEETLKKFLKGDS